MQTVKKLVENLGYPRSMLDWKFDPGYMVRGLAIDKVLADDAALCVVLLYCKLAYIYTMRPLSHNEAFHCELDRPEETC